MRPTRLIYVENDPSLRGIMSQSLQAHPDIELLLQVGSPREAMERVLVEKTDVALLDLALGSKEMNGIDLGLAMRSWNENIGIVIHSQYRLDTVARSVPPEALFGWSTLAKSGETTIDEVVDVIRSTAAGHRLLESNVPAVESPLLDLTMRQRAVMGMTASGIKATEIARRLAVTQETIRQDLSKAYRVLVPEADQNDDLRIRAIFAYLELIRDDDERDGI